MTYTVCNVYTLRCCAKILRGLHLRFYMASAHTAPDRMVDFAIKSPVGGNSPTFTLRAPLSATVLDLKNKLQKEYPGHPEAHLQTIIYAGKVLREDALCVTDFLRPKLEESTVHSLHLVIKDNKIQSQQSPYSQAQSQTSAGPSGYSPPPFQPRPTPQTRQGAQADTAQARSAQPQNAAMLAAYQAALDTFVNNRQPQHVGPQGQQQRTDAAQSAPQPGSTEQPQSAQGQPNHSNAPAQSQAPMYAMHAPAMVAYIPVLIPSPYGAAQHAWPQQQQQQQQQQGIPGPGQPPLQYPYPPFMPMLLPYGMPPPAGGMPPGPFQMHMAGAHHPGAPQAPPNAAWRMGPRQRHGAQMPAGGGVAGVANGPPANLFRMRRGPGMHVRMIRIDLKALVQMAVAGIVLYQHCPPGRFLLLMGGGALLYLTGVGPLQRALQRLVALALPAPIRAPQAGQGAAAGQPPAAPQWTFFGELQAVVVGFFSSLIPGWNMNAEDAAAFAAAQQLQAAEAARDQRAAGGQNNLHQD